MYLLLLCSISLLGFFRYCCRKLFHIWLWYLHLFATRIRWYIPLLCILSLLGIITFSILSHTFPNYLYGFIDSHPVTQPNHPNKHNKANPRQYLPHPHTHRRHINNNNLHQDQKPSKQPLNTRQTPPIYFIRSVPHCINYNQSRIKYHKWYHQYRLLRSNRYKHQNEHSSAHSHRVISVC